MNPPQPAANLSSPGGGSAPTPLLLPRGPNANYGDVKPDLRSIEADSDGDAPTFITGGPITHPRRFFGRQRPLKRLFNLLKRQPLQNAAIIGQRRSGKTSANSLSGTAV